MSSFGKFIKKIRLEKGLSQEDIAEKMDLSVSSYSKLETGKVDPTLSKIEKLASILEFDLGEYAASLKVEQHSGTEDPDASDLYRFVNRKEYKDLISKLEGLERIIQNLAINN